MALDLDIQQLRSAMEAQGLSQAELVERSGVSRAQLSRLLSQERVKVRDQTISRLANALSLDPAALLVEGREQAYRDWILTENGFLDFRGLGMPQLQKQPLGDIFVEPELAAWDLEAMRVGPVEPYQEVPRPPEPIDDETCPAEEGLGVAASRLQDAVGNVEILERANI